MKPPLGTPWPDTRTAAACLALALMVTCAACAGGTSEPPPWEVESLRLYWVVGADLLPPSARAVLREATESLGGAYSDTLTVFGTRDVSRWYHGVFNDRESAEAFVDYAAPYSQLGLSDSVGRPNIELQWVAVFANRTDEYLLLKLWCRKRGDGGLIESEERIWDCGDNGAKPGHRAVVNGSVRKRGYGAPDRDDSCLEWIEAEAHPPTGEWLALWEPLTGTVRFKLPPDNGVGARSIDVVHRRDGLLGQDPATDF